MQGSDGEPDRDSPSRDPSPDGDLSVDQGRGSRPVSPRNKGSSRNSLPRPDVQSRTGALGSNPSHHSSKRRRSSSDSDSSRSDVSRGRSRHKLMKSRHRSRSLSGLGIDVITTVGLDPRDIGVGHLGPGQGLYVLGPDNTNTGLSLVLDTRVLKIMLFPL